MSATITSTGTSTVPAVLPGTEDATVVENSLTRPIYDARAGVASDVAYFQELNSFIGVMSAELGISPLAAIVRCQNMLHAMTRDRNTGE